MKKRSLVLFIALCCIVTTFCATMSVSYAAGGGQGVATAAASYLEKASGSTFGWGNENWCGRFLYRCAEDAGETAAMCGSVDTMKSTNGAMAWFASHAKSVGYFYDQITLANYGLNTGHKANKSDYSPEVGDIIFYDWDGDHNNLGHMEVVTSVSGRQITTIGGSTGGSCSGWNGVLHVHKHTYDISNAYIVAYVRPSYGGASVPTEPPQSELLLLPASEPGEHRAQGSPFYFRGTASSNYLITSSTVQVRLDDNMTVIMEKTVTPNKYKIDVLADGLDSLKFGTLEEGNYNFWWLVKDDSGTLKSWVAHFSVGYPTESTPTPTPTPSPTPTPTPSSTTPTPEPAPVQNCAKGHSWGSWKTIREPACEAEGRRQRVCSVCGKEETETLSPLAHSYQVKQETDTFTLYSCIYCSESYVEEKELVDHTPDLEALFPVVRSWSLGTFSDIASKDWYYDHVKDVYQRGLMNGTGRDRFQPKETLTVAQAITLAARIHAAYYGNTIPSFDGGRWYDGAVSYARQNGIPADGPYEIPATREVFAYILSACLPEDALLSNGSSIDFADAELFQYPAAIEMLCRAGIINGISQNGAQYFDPFSTITRAQAAAVITRMIVPASRLGN